MERHPASARGGVIDGLQPEHDARRKPATYERILKTLEGREADVSWAIMNQMMERPGYLDEYLAFWTFRPEIGRIRRRSRFALSVAVPLAPACVGCASSPLLSACVRVT